MSIKSIEISGLRSFAEAQRLDLAMPNGNLGGGLTVLVGPNNGGKSTIIEAFAYLTQIDNQSFTEGKRNKTAGDVASIQVTYASDRSKTLRTVAGRGSETLWDNAPEQPEASSVFVLPSRRTFNPFFNKNMASRESYITASGIPRMRTSSIDHFSARLFQIQQNRKGFDDVLLKILDPVPSWYIDQTEGGQYYLKFNSGNSFHSSEGIGEGYISLLFIVDALYDSQPGQTVVIDEPELSLHPSLQRRLIDLFSEYSIDRQIVISTHSPYFISWESIVNGGKVVRVNKSDHRTRLFELSSDTITKIRGLLKNLYNPHILGLDAREVFFLQDGLILVEGQEDVVQFKRITKQLSVTVSGDFFGWGVGGADNMRIIAKMLSELGFKKVVGILDDNKKVLQPMLQADFPDYKFVVIPADDVRTKPAIDAKQPVKGLLDETGKMRREYETPMRALLAEVDGFLTSH